MVATVCSATAGSSACIASTTAGGKVISSLVVLTSSLFAEDRTYRPVHAERSDNRPDFWACSDHDRNRSAPQFGPAGAGQAARPGAQGRRAGHHAPAALG